MHHKEKEMQEILAETLPCIRNYRNKILVIKYGGNAMLNFDLKSAVINDLIFLYYTGIRIVLVHGGGPEIDSMLKKTGKESRFVNGLRYTDEETMEIVQMVLCGKINKDICALIQKSGGKAAGISGIDGALFSARRLNAELGFVGDITGVDVSVLNTLLDAGIIPVVSSVAMDSEDESGHSLNINADIAAAKIASALNAEELILLSDIRGIYRDINDENSFIAKISRNELELLKKDGKINKGMIPKADCCLTALDGGVKNVRIIDGRKPHSLLAELFTGNKNGTIIVR